MHLLSSGVLVAALATVLAISTRRLALSDKTVAQSGICVEAPALAAETNPWRGDEYICIPLPAATLVPAMVCVREGAERVKCVREGEEGVCERE